MMGARPCGQRTPYFGVGFPDSSGRHSYTPIIFQSLSLDASDSAVNLYIDHLASDHARTTRPE